MKKIFKICSTSLLTLTLGFAVSGCGKKKDITTTSSKTNSSKTTSSKTSDNTNKTTKKNKTTKQALKTAEKGSFIINFVDDDDSIIDSISVKEGEMPQVTTNPTKDSDETYTYEFDGWDKKIVVASKNETYKATYKSTFINYTITFMDGSNEISSDDYHYGDTITIPDALEKDHYTFKGWSTIDGGEVEEVSSTVSKSITYYAAYAIDKHTYTFYGEDGTSVIKTSTINYGDIIEAPDDPKKNATAQYTYTFDGWYTKATDGVKVTSFGNIEGDVSYYARFNQTTNKYTITWLNDDDSLIDTTEVNYGEMPTHSNPSKAKTQQYSYTFSGWSPSLSTVVGNATYKATFTTTTNKYTYAFYDNTTPVKTLTVDYGTQIEPPADPTRNSDEYYLEFMGWYTANSGGTQVTNFGTITTNVNYYARYHATSKKKYSVSYYSYDGGPFITSFYNEWGTAITAPTAPTRSGYTFNGWSQNVTSIPKYNLNVYGTWTVAQPYTLKVNVDSNWYYDVKYSGVTNTSYNAGTSVTLKVDSKTPTYTVVWNVNGTTYTGDSVTFAMPSKNTTVTISCLPYTVVSSTKLQMGMYPQTKASTTEYDSLVKNSKAHVTTSNMTFDKNYWYKNTYKTTNGTEYDIWFIDIDLDDDGYYDYRGVTFSTYLPADTSKALGAENSNQDDNRYYAGAFYFFKYEPITWIISLNDTDYNKQYLYAEKVLDAQIFYPSVEVAEINHNGSNAKPNSYRFSNLYAWMVDKFGAAFTSKQIQLLTTVSCSGTAIKYGIVQKETVTSTHVMKTNDDRRAAPTDYAKCMGVHVNNGYSEYWTSSPATQGNMVIIVDDDGSCSTTNSTAPKEYACCISGIRPFIAFDTTKITL